MQNAAITIHSLAKSLGVPKARVVGHDIGLMVAYAYAAQFPAETEKLVVMDAFLPGVAGWEDVYDNPGIWHFRFNGPTPEALVRGRERDSLRALLERLRGRQDAFDFRKPIAWRMRPLCPPGPNALRLGLFCFVSASGEGFLPTIQNQAVHAGAGNRWREGEWNIVGTTDEDRG